MSAQNRNGAAEPWFAKLMVLAAEVTGTVLTEARIRGYAQLLDDCDDQALTEAFRACLQEGSSRFPNVPDLRAACGVPPLHERAVLMWGALLRTAADAGCYLSVQFADGRAAAAVEAIWGSWPAACQELGDGPQAAIRRQEFLAQYKAARTAPPKRLHGLCETLAGGMYALDARVWTATLTAGGALQVHRDAPSLASGVAQRRQITQ